MKPSGQWCDGRANGSFDQIDDYDFNEGWYPGTWPSPVQACQRLYRPSDGTTMVGSSCSYDWTGVNYGTITCNCWESNAMQISGGNHSIVGSANTN